MQALKTYADDDTSAQEGAEPASFSDLYGAANRDRYGVMFRSKKGRTTGDLLIEWYASEADARFVLRMMEPGHPDARLISHEEAERLDAYRADLATALDRPVSRSTAARYFRTGYTLDAALYAMRPIWTGQHKKAVGKLGVIAYFRTLALASHHKGEADEARFYAGIARGDFPQLRSILRCRAEFAANGSYIAGVMGRGAQ